jgi:putative nucleotidyltransferase with HDIG domain
MSRPLKISRKETLKQLGIAGMFHDIGLADEYDYLHQTDRSKMTAEQKMIFEGHPQRGAELLDEMGCMDSLTPQIVAQHHARRDNSGFPKSVAAGSIHLFSELIGLAEECVRWADQQPNISRSQILEKMEKSTFSGFSVKALEFFKGVMTS